MGRSPADAARRDPPGRPGRRWPTATPARCCGRSRRPARRSGRASPSPARPVRTGSASADRPRSVLVASLGGSALVGDVLTLLAGPGSPVPVSVRRNLPLPGWVGPLDLVVAVLAVRPGGRPAGPRGRGRSPGRPAADGRSRRLPARLGQPAGSRHPRAGRARAGPPRARPCGRCWCRCWSPPTAWAWSRSRVAPSRLPPTASTRSPTRPGRPRSRSSTRRRSWPSSWPAPCRSSSATVTWPVSRPSARPPCCRGPRAPRRSGASLPDDASQVVAAFDGPFTATGSGGSATDDVFADPFLDAAPGPASAAAAPARRPARADDARGCRCGSVGGRGQDDGGGRRRAGL